MKNTTRNEANNAKNEAKMKRNIMSNRPYCRSVKAHGKTRINKENEEK